MLKVVKKCALCFVCAVSLLFSSFAVSAEENYEDGHITIDTVSALNGDSVIVKIGIENNPGIMAMTLSITYDSSALTYERYYWGYLGDYTVVDHPDKNLIRFVNCESMNLDANRTMISLQFKVKEDAEFGFYPIDIEYKSGDFCNWKLDRLMPVITSGGVNVEFNGENCSHKEYGEWETAAEPTCTQAGAKQRVCEKCGHVDISEIPAAGHDFAAEWTIDRQATGDSSGIMSRHCKNCEEVTDVLSFTLEQSEENEIDNTEGSVVAPSDLTDELVKEQLPEVYENNGGSSIPKADEGSAAADGSGIINKISENSEGRIAKILSSISDFKWLKIALISALIINMRLFVL